MVVKEYCFGDFATFKYGKMPNKDRMTECGKYPVYSGYRYVGYYDEYNTEADQLIVVARGVGGTGDVKITTERCFLTNLSISAIIDEDVALPKYLYYFYKPRNLRYLDSGSAQSQITISDLEKIRISLPDINTQRLICNYLEAIDNKIELNNNINKNLLQQTIALYECVLQDSEWPTATILDIAEKVAMGPFGSNIKVSTFVTEGVPIISGNHLRGHFLEEPEFNYITEEHADRLKNSIVRPHDLVFTHAGNIGQVAMIPDGCKYAYYVLSQRQFYLRCDESKVLPEFLLMFFHSAPGQHELLSYANQTGVPSIAQPASNLKKIPFQCPPIQVQLKWQEQVRPLLNRYLSNRYENERLASLRDILLPKLMAGELDVSTLDV